MDTLEGSGNALGEVRKGKRYVGRGKGVKNVPPVLRAMRAVFKQAKEKDVGPEQSEVRKLLENDPKAFIAQMSALERSYLALKGGAKSQQQGPEGARSESPDSSAREDGGSDRVLSLVERLLSEWEGGK